MITAEPSIAYLLSTPHNHTCTYLADHLEGVSHDTVRDFLRTTRITARDLWHLVQTILHARAEAYLMVDDRVQDTRYSHFIALVKRQ